MTEQQERDLQSALVECRRFVSAAKLALEKHHENMQCISVREKFGDGVRDDKKIHVKGMTSSLAAAKRASMDLARALTRFRRRPLK